MQQQAIYLELGASHMSDRTSKITSSCQSIHVFLPALPNAIVHADDKKMHTDTCVLGAEKRQWHPIGQRRWRRHCMEVFSTQLYYAVRQPSPLLPPIVLFGGQLLNDLYISYIGAGWLHVYIQRTQCRAAYALWRSQISVIFFSAKVRL